jgi:hypothetical protein
MNWIPTAIALIGALLASVAAYTARVHRDHAEREGRRIAALRARVLSLDAMVETLTQQHRKLRGAFYQSRAPIEPEPPAEDQLELDVCDNWRRAVVEGPTSSAASCECNYCARARVNRAAVRAKLVPKSQADRIEAMRRGQAQP